MTRAEDRTMDKQELQKMNRQFLIDEYGAGRVSGAVSALNELIGDEAHHVLTSHHCENLLVRLQDIDQ